MCKECDGCCYRHNCNKDLSKCCYLHPVRRNDVNNPSFIDLQK